MERYVNNQSYVDLTNQIHEPIELGLHSKIFYDGQEVHGTISYEDVCKYVKVGTFQDGESHKQCLVIRNEYLKGGILGEFSLGMEGVRYIDLENGTELLRYEYFRGITEAVKANARPVVSFSENFEILGEEDFSDWLVRLKKIHSDYSVKDLLEIYYEHVSCVDKSKNYVKSL